MNAQNEKNRTMGSRLLSLLLLSGTALREIRAFRPILRRNSRNPNNSIAFPCRSEYDRSVINFKKRT